MIRITLGILIGIAITFIFIHVYSNVNPSKNYVFSNDGGNSQLVQYRKMFMQNKIDTLQFSNTVTDFNLKNALIDEKINTLNTRFSDLYVLGGILITILLAINIGVFLRTETEVQKHMQDNFESYNKKIIALHAEASKKAAEIATLLEIASKKQIIENKNQQTV